MKFKVDDVIAVVKPEFVKSQKGNVCKIVRIRKNRLNTDDGILYLYVCNGLKNKGLEGYWLSDKEIMKVSDEEALAWLI